MALDKALVLSGTVRVDVEAPGKALDKALERMRMQVILLLKCSVVKLLVAVAAMTVEDQERADWIRLNVIENPSVVRNEEDNVDEVQMEELTVPQVEAAMVLLRVGLLLPPQAQLKQEVSPVEVLDLLPMPVNTQDA